ncbi:tyrosine-type recombinase/integrase [Burkholderia gladioli]|uniref:tyrosine-type recombinase/integrase n=1 Tax=Burkholderia gladioli TaxID=28095 RepID=UPI00163E8DAC|nr:site-specific integrase [Burkholderia gladioli]
MATEEVIKVGSGTVVKRPRKDGTFSYQSRVRKQGSGNISQTFKTLKEAKEFITLTDSKILKGESVNHPKIKKTTLGVIFQEYLESHKKLTYAKKNRINKLIEEIGNVILSNFKTKAFQAYIDVKLTQTIPDQKKKKKEHKLYNGNRDIDKDGKRVARVYKPSSIRKYYYDIRVALAWHAKVNDYHFDSKPFDDVEPPPAWGNPRERRLEDGELDRILKACDRLYVNQAQSQYLIKFLAYSAFRIGETMMIKWRDVVLDEKTPENSYIFIPRENQKIAHKKGAENRYASIRPELFYLMLELREKYKKNDDDLVFPFWSSAQYFYTRFKNICYNANVQNMTVHDLRHDGVCWFFEHTLLSDIEISKITGHIELDTLKKYANLRPRKTGAKLWASIQ